MRAFKTALLVSSALLLSAVASADSVVESWQCKLKDDAKIEDVQAMNSKWLKFVNDNIKGGKITSSVGTAIVGSQNSFLFVDVYPDLATWAAAKEALDSDAADELDDIFDDLNECKENRLWKMEDTK